MVQIKILIVYCDGRWREVLLLSVCGHLVYKQLEPNCKLLSKMYSIWKASNLEEKSNGLKIGERNFIDGLS